MWGLLDLLCLGCSGALKASYFGLVAGFWMVSVLDARSKFVGTLNPKL